MRPLSAGTWSPCAAAGRRRGDSWELAALTCRADEHRSDYAGPLQVFGRGAKFSMFKPAEEMVYIGLDAESRTKGKAAIDVVGAQTGKSLGAVVQQVRPSGPLRLNPHSTPHSSVAQLTLRSDTEWNVHS